LSNTPHSNSSLAASLEGMQLRDYIDIARRRKWWIIFSATAVFVATTVGVLHTPDVYRSETVIIVDPQKVSDSVVQPTVNSSVSDRLTMIRQLATSPTRLKTIVEKLNLYPELRTRGVSDGAIARVQKNINVEVIDSGGQRASSFRIGFTSKNPTVAAAVANELGGMIIRDNLQVREQAFVGAKDFLDTQLDETKQKLEQKEMEVQRIKTQYVMDLPESKQFHLEALNSLRNQLRTSEDRVNQDKQEKVYLQSTLNNAAPPTVDLDATNIRVNSPYQSAIQKEEAHLAELQARYGPEYPDVRKVRNTLEELKARAAQEQKEAGPPPPEEDPAKLAQRAKHSNPVVQAQITKLDQEIEEETKRQTELEPQIATHMGKLANEPVFEQQISGLMRDYDTLRALYNRLLDKKLSAQMALELENSQQGEKFVILDRAQVPQAPTGPNRPLFIAAGLIGGLLGGLALAMLVEMTDESVRSEREAAQILGKSVLAEVPAILAPQEKMRKAFRAATALAGVACASALLGYALPLIFKGTA
jgi:protein tyrosine kinase modulator